MKNREALDGIGVLGANVKHVVSGFGGFTLLATQILVEEDLGEDDGTGMIACQPDRWYSLSRFLNAVDRIGKEFGEHTLQQVGAAILKASLLPTWTLDFEVAL